MKYALTPVKKLKSISYKGSVNHNLILLPHPREKSFITLNDRFITIELLNKEKKFHKRIDWTFNGYGLLWNYNLQYADFLRQRDLPVSVRESFILDLLNCLHNGKLKPEPYPSSLRVMNTVRFLIHNFELIQDTKSIINGIASELHFISKRIEYHLMGNHLLENGFALLMGGTYLSNAKWTKIGEKIIQDQLDEQILTDGAHFERSLMYHQIILFRILEAIGYLHKKSDFRKYLKVLASKMLSWSKAMTLRDNSAAHFNDSVAESTYLTTHLNSLASSIDVNTELKLQLSDSGFRKFTTNSSELIIDVESIKPDYQPGHAHADSLSFIMNLYGKAFIVDPAISTYNTGERRNWERSTRAHNTVTVEEENSADVWSSFRVGRRPIVRIINESKKQLKAKAVYRTNSGTEVGHKRNITISNNNISITDNVNCSRQPIGRFYFSPEIEIKKIMDTTVEFSNGTLLIFKKIKRLNKFDYEYSKGYNNRVESFGIEYIFDDTCVVEFKIVKQL